MIYILLYHVHVRTVIQHGDGNQLHAKECGNGEMSVIPRYHAEELHLIQSAPGGIAHNAVGIGTGNGIIHDV